MGTICILFDDSCSYGYGNTLSSSLIDNRQFETDMNTSFVDSDTEQCWAQASGFVHHSTSFESLFNFLQLTQVDYWLY